MKKYIFVCVLFLSVFLLGCKVVPNDEDIILGAIDESEILYKQDSNLSQGETGFESIETLDDENDMQEMDKNYGGVNIEFQIVD